MSTPTSTAPEDPAQLRQAVARAVGAEPVASDPSMAALRDAEIGTPLLAGDDDGMPAFWLVPLLQADRACGYARVDLCSRVTQVSAFGAGARDSAAWPQADYFRAPPQQWVDELSALHPDEPLAPPRFSFDTNPARWAWRIAVGRPPSCIAYIAHEGWYEKPVRRR